MTGSREAGDSTLNPIKIHRKLYIDANVQRCAVLYNVKRSFDPYRGNDIPRRNLVSSEDFVVPFATWADMRAPFEEEAEGGRDAKKQDERREKKRRSDKRTAVDRGTLIFLFEASAAFCGVQ